MAGLYIHIPYCRSKCIYCDFYSTPRIADMEQTINALISEFESRRSELTEPISTVYLGGGTPSVLPPELLKKLIGRISLEKVEEFTIEANPDDITDNLLRSWLDMGIDRLSLGVQSLDDGILHSLRRRHNSSTAISAIEAAHNAGFRRISADLMYGIPGLSDQVLSESVDLLTQMPIDHLSAYCLTYYDGTALKIMLEKGKMIPPSDEIIENQYHLVRNKLAEAGFEHYEISNFCKPGHHSRHNSAYWEARSQWLGIGPAAHSFDGKYTRRANPASIKDWMDKIPKSFEIEVENAHEHANSIIFTALRTYRGLNLDDLPQEMTKTVIDSSKRFIDHGLMSLDDNIIRIKPEHWLIADAIITDLMV